MKKKLNEYIDNKVMQPLKKYFDKFSYKDNMETSATGTKYWNGEFSPVQKEDLVQRYKHYYPEFLIDKYEYDLCDELDDDEYEEIMDYLVEKRDEMDEYEDEENTKAIDDLFKQIALKCGYVDEFADYLANNLKRGYYIKQSPPTWSYHDYQNPVPKRQWCIHFSDNAKSIFETGKFTIGSAIDKLAVTTGYDSGDYALAYPVDDFFLGPLQGHKGPTNMTNRASDYGQEAVMFQTSALKTWHYGDKEYQVIFDKNKTDNMILLQNDGEYWFITDKDTGKVLIKKKTIYEMVQWVLTNVHQYRHRIIKEEKKTRKIKLTENQLRQLINESIIEIFKKI